MRVSPPSLGKYGRLEREKNCLFRRVRGFKERFDVLGEAEIPRGATFCPQHGCSVEECVKQASVTSFEAMQPSGCRGVQAGVQAADSSRCALCWQVRGRRASRARAAGLQCT
eukprot:scaffold11928_cov111-Isochrysis_galbana.AAC.1